MTAMALFALCVFVILTAIAFEIAWTLKRIAGALDAIRYQQNIIANCELELVKVHSGAAAQQKWRA